MGRPSTSVVLGRRLGGKKLLRNGKTPPAFMICCCERSCQFGKKVVGREKVGLLYRVSFNLFLSHACSLSLYLLVLSPAPHAVVLRCILQMQCHAIQDTNDYTSPMPARFSYHGSPHVFFFRITSDDVCPHLAYLHASDKENKYPCTEARGPQSDICRCVALDDELRRWMR